MKMHCLCVDDALCHTSVLVCVVRMYDYDVSAVTVRAACTLTHWGSILTSTYALDLLHLYICSQSMKFMVFPMHAHTCRTMTIAFLWYFPVYVYVRTSFYFILIFVLDICHGIRFTFVRQRQSVCIASVRACLCMCTRCVFLYMPLPQYAHVYPHFWLFILYILTKPRMADVAPGFARLSPSLALYAIRWAYARYPVWFGHTRTCDVISLLLFSLLVY